MTLIAAADGSALGNPGAAGWAWFIDEHRWRAGGWPHATNNQAELMAVLSLLQETAHIDEPLHILCDSQYVINSLTVWMPGWKRKGWKKSDGKPVQNRDLLEQLDAQLVGRDVTFEWVKGHSGHPLNERADDIAQQTAASFQSGRPVQVGPGLAEPQQASAPSPSLFDLFDEGDAAEAAITSQIDRVIENEQKIFSEPAAQATSRFLSAESTLITVHGERVEGRDRILATLRNAPVAQASIDVLQATEISDGLIQLVFRLQTPVAMVCSSLWQREDSEWIRRFHQQTAIVPG